MGGLPNLTDLIKDTAGVKLLLRNFSVEDKALAELKSSKVDPSDLQPVSNILSSCWQDLLKSVALEQLFLRRNSVQHVTGNVIRPLRVIATCAPGKEPWQITVEDVKTAVRIGRKIQASGKLADLIIGQVKGLFDGKHLVNAGPLSAALTDPRLGAGGSVRRANYLKSTDELRHTLEARKSNERLPEGKAFWELIRIVMTEKPQTFVDELRFACLKLLITTGFRIGEAVLLPVDWRREREYLDSKGRKADLLGGYSKSLMIRHFAEKQQLSGLNSFALYERTQHVPKIFECLLEETLDNAVSLTSPLRKTLKLQVESGRIIPNFHPEDLVPAPLLYPYLTGNPFWVAMNELKQTDWVVKCRNGYNQVDFDELYDQQRCDFVNQQVKLDGATYMYLNRMINPAKSGQLAVSLRSADGTAYLPNTIRWKDAYFNIAELEAFIMAETPTKISDTESLQLANGALLQPWELLFLHPKRSLAEERNNGLCDTSRCLGIGRPDSTLVGLALGEIKGRRSIFARYGQTEDDKTLVLTSHMLRHLQNTELFRLGVADTIITKR
ncbi:hypothetical protein [Paraperlucidibaca sp.]|jgi:hypothetical protein|uniref:hypothetical protein n=1 Tax=Paraperlucidibaca sp. TaxID=2708021 RepID=UPI00398980DB